MAGLRLAGKVTLLTGAGSGMGKATALLFAREGAQVLAATSEAADLAPLEQESHGLSGALTAIQMDVTREADAVRAVGTAAERYGGLDILVNNAGIASFGVAADTTAEQWQQVRRAHVSPIVRPEWRRPRLYGGSLDHASGRLRARSHEPTKREIG